MLLAQIESTTGTANKVANYLFEHSSEIVVALVILTSLVIALCVFLIALWNEYKKYSLILKKHNIDPANEDISELKKYEKNF